MKEDYYFSLLFLKNLMNIYDLKNNFGFSLNLGHFVLNNISKRKTTKQLKQDQTELN